MRFLKILPLALVLSSFMFLTSCQEEDIVLSGEGDSTPIVIDAD